MGDVPYHSKVVGDKEVGDAEISLQILHQVHDLGADRDIQGGDRFVGHDEFGAQSQCPGDPYPLALSAAERMGVATARIRRNPTRSISSLTFCVAWFAASPWTTKGSATMSTILIRGFKLA